ncbi:hypothetical protein N7G274_009271 [Stereocaulon virgatum]|uniref:Uncharacterized protein n=1 Tax=Stereocaulon virgatum TaxID=373712 RepID=A0ABR3ZYI0_9LECA
MWEFAFGLSSRYGVLVPKALDHLTTFTLLLALASCISIDLSHFSGPVADGSHSKIPVGGSLHEFQAFPELSPSTTLVYSRGEYRDFRHLREQIMTESPTKATSSI